MNTDETKIHELKTLPKYFELVKMGIKNFEVRKNDRDFEVGDLLLLREWSGEYSGRQRCREIGYILDDESYCKEGYVILGFAISQGGRL